MQNPIAILIALLFSLEVLGLPLDQGQFLSPQVTPLLHRGLLSDAGASTAPPFSSDAHTQHNLKRGWVKKVKLSLFGPKLVREHAGWKVYKKVTPMTTADAISYGGLNLKSDQVQNTERGKGVLKELKKYAPHETAKRILAWLGIAAIPVVGTAGTVVGVKASD